MDFVICCNKADKRWADWVGWQLEEEKYKVWHPEWDILAGQNQIIAIQQKLCDKSARMILILSQHFDNKSIQE